MKLPDSVGVKDKGVEEATYLRNHPLQLNYVCREYFGQQATQGELVYEIDWRSYNFSYIDAFTGHEIHRGNNQEGTEMKEWDRTVNVFVMTWTLPANAEGASTGAGVTKPMIVMEQEPVPAADDLEGSSDCQDA